MNFFVITLFALAVVVSGQTCLAETNEARRNNGNLAPFGNNDQLVQAAINHNNAMVAGNCFSHQCPGEPSLGDRVTSAGYRWGGLAENLAAGSNNCEGSVNQWMGSDGHRANILGNYRHIGCASISCNCQYGTYWTCVYASPL